MSRPQSEKAWVLTDGVGQPCLRFITHRNASLQSSPPDLPKDLSPEWGPYRWAAYRLIPDEEAT